MMAEMVASHLPGLGGRTEREWRRGRQPAGPPVVATIAPSGGAASGLPPSAPAPPTRWVQERPRRRQPRSCRHPSRCYQRRWIGDGEAATAAAAAQLLGRGRGLGVPDDLVVATVAAANATAALFGSFQAYASDMEWSCLATSRASGGGGGGSVLAT